MSIRLAWIATLTAAAMSSACDTKDKVAGVYCDKNEDCASGRLCDTSFHSCYLPSDQTCVAQCEQSDLSVDLGAQCEARCAGDMAVPSDLGDLNADLFNADLTPPPDLMPRCAVAADCVDLTKPICDATLAGGTCRACATSSDDTQCAAHAPSPICLTEGTNAGKCGTCRPANGSATNGNACATAAPVCDVSGTCRTCRAHSECPSGICKLDGSCAAAAEIEYVMNDSGTTCVASGAGAGTAIKPWCQIDNAMQSSTAHFFLVAKGSYGQLSHTQATTTMLFVGPGPGLTDANSAVIAENNKAGIALTAGGNTLDLTFDGVVIGTVGANVKANGHSGVELNGTATTQTTFRLLRSTVRDNQNQGLDILASTLLVDQCVLTNNAAGAIQLSGADFTITNSLISANGTGGGAGSAFGGVNVATTATVKTLYNLTVVNNLAMDGLASGITCGASTPIGNTVLSGNSTGDVSSVLCQPASCAYVGATGNGNASLTGCAVTDTFVSASDFHLATTAAGSQAHCVLVDKGVTPTGALKVPAHDVAGVARPQGAAWDIGAYETP